MTTWDARDILTGFIYCQFGNVENGLCEKCPLRENGCKTTEFDEKTMLEALKVAKI